jgi:anti-anti-sigma factor
MYLKKEQVEEGLTIITLTGRFDLQAVVEIGDEFTAHATGGGGVIVDLRGVNFMASVAIRLLITSAKQNAGKGGGMVMYGADPLIMESLNVSGITKLIPLFEDYHSALASLKH